MFAGLPADDLVAVADVVRELDASAGQVLTIEGRLGHDAFVVLEGLIEVRRDDELVEVLGEGAMVGEVAVFTDGRRNATVIARTDVRLGVIEQQALLDLVDAIPLLADRLSAVVRIRSTG
jgi:CRP-like cAMP-binding protein